MKPRFTTTIIQSGILALLAAITVDAWADSGSTAVSTPPAAILPPPAPVVSPPAAKPAVTPSAPPVRPADTMASTGMAAAMAAASMANMPGVSVGQQVVPPVSMPKARRRRPVKPISDVDPDAQKAALLWARNGQAAGVIGDNGTVMYGYGETRPTIHCAPLHLCVIKLMHGEQITDISIGDGVRWKVASSRAGDIPVIVLKPATVGLETNLSVLTDAGRVYYMTLRSAAQGSVPLVQFFSPEELIAKANARTGQLAQQAQSAQETRDASLGKLDPATLDFHYTCTGKARFKPTEVFSGNGHIYMKMPDDMKYHDSPAVFDMSNDTTQLINSRLARGYQVLDGLPEKFKLVVGAGSDAQTIECTHAGSKGSSDQSDRPSGGNVPRSFGN